MTPEELYLNEVTHCIRSAIGQGARDLQTILTQCDGADPRLVATLINELGHPVERAEAPSSPSGDVYLALPAGDPFRSQWWFTGDTISSLATRAITIARDDSVLCLGTPTIGHTLAGSAVRAIILDVDQHVVSAVNKASGGNPAAFYDVADEMPKFPAAFRLAVIDPPWYEDVFKAFVGRALSVLSVGGELLCTLPSRLTRPGIDDFRRSFITELVTTGHEILSLEAGAVSYVVPRFEEMAFQNVSGFRAIPWRRADLLHLRKAVGAKAFTIPKIDKMIVETFARSPQEFRVFLNHHNSLTDGSLLRLLEKYSENVSTRAHEGEIPDVWTTEKKGALVGQVESVRCALRVWQDIRVRSATDAAHEVREQIGAAGDDVVRLLDTSFGLWTDFGSQPALRTDNEIEAAKKSTLTEWASPPSPREHPDVTDTFRAAFQRDRDRVLWSGSLRALAHKTQLFPMQHDDQLRQRFTHSIEVMQLASTIGASFGLDRDLVEAGALAHDIGHTPFGHAGEHALNRLLNDVNEKLGGFNHYEHGVDVVRWLEGPYAVSSVTAFRGLNLTPEVAECIFKHTYCQAGNSESADELYKISKNSDFIPAGFCHLEGQAVRIADKISYFVSDLEDGIRLGAITSDDLLSCRFFYRAPLNFHEQRERPLYQTFVGQRRNVLKVLMEDVLVETNKRLARITPDKIRTLGEYTVNHSDEILHDMNEVWQRLQKGKLHEDRRVKLANLRAARIISDLVVIFAIYPQLVDSAFSTEHARLRSQNYMKNYQSRVGESVTIHPHLTDILSVGRTIGTEHQPGKPITLAVEDMVQAKDFVAGLPDSRARSLHAELFGA